MLLHDAALKTAKWLDGWNIEVLLVAPLLSGALIWFAAYADPRAVDGALAMFVALSPLWLPVALFFMFWTIWMHYIRFLFWAKTENVLLEIQLPPEIEKSPLAMELFLTTLVNTGGEATFIKRIWQGSYRPIWSLEIASNGGRIGYYLHLRRAFKNVVEARLYGQFPEAKIREVEDYAAKVPFNLEEYDLWGAEFQKGEIDALPIFTYINYGLHESPDKPEIQVDPISHVTELFGSIGPGEHFWMQIVAKARKKDEWYGFYYGKDSYKEAAKAKIKEITEGAIKRAKELTSDEAEQKKVGSRGAMLLTGGEKNKVEAIERSLTKMVFECGIRVIYFAKKDRYYGPHAANVIGLFNPLRYPDYNGLGITRGTTIFDYPWQDIAGIREARAKRNLFYHYRDRAYFYVPYDQVPVMLTTEELATLWHFPNSFVKSPGLDRVSSRRAEAPPNLPTAPQNLPT
jgi:hypothetical protein